MGDQINGFQGVIGPLAVFVRELNHFYVGHIKFVSSEQNVDANQGRSLGAFFFNSDVNA